MGMMFFEARELLAASTKPALKGSRCLGRGMPLRRSRVRWLMPSEDNPGERAAIGKTEPPRRNGVSDRLVSATLVTPYSGWSEERKF